MEWVDLVISGARGYKYIDTARQIDSLYYDVYMPIGTLEYFLCRSSSSIQLIGKLFGMQSDCMEAIDKLEIASLNSRFSWIESRNVLSYIYLYIERDYTISSLNLESYIKNTINTSFDEEIKSLLNSEISLLNQHNFYNLFNILTLISP